MTFSKLLFYILYLFNGLSLFFYLGTLYYNMTSRKEFTGKNENLIFFLAIVIIAVGVYLAHNKAYNYQNLTSANIALVAAWLGALIVVITGLFFLNRPIKWN